MHTITLHQAETRAVSIAARPESVVAYLADGHNLPEWAPNFATETAVDGDLWRIGSGDAAFTIAIRASREHGTVDLLNPADRRQGAFMRVVPNLDGSELLFTLQFPAGTDPGAIDAQMTVVEAELQTVRDRCEREAAGA